MIRFCNAFAVLMAALCTAKTASALPLVWRADWPDAKPVETMVHRGTDVELQPQWRINKEPADTTGWTFTTYCQTNAVGPWFGPLPGAFFSHTNDVGAASYNVIVRAQTPGGDVNYTAFARLRMLDSPGYAPGVLPLPTQSIDFADVTVFNAPYYTKQETDERIVALAPAPGNYAAVSNAAMSAAAQTNDFLRLAGGGRISTSEYDFIIGYDRLLAPRSGIWWQDLAAPCGIGCESLLGNLVFVSEGNWVHLPDRPGTLALRSDVAAAAEAATNYTNAAIAEIPVPPPADFSTSNAALVATIEATAPAPGDYETVSNRAMNAGGNFLAVDGPFEWTAEKGITLKNGFLVFDNTTTGGGRLATTYDAVRTDNAYASWDDIITAANAHAEGLNATTGALAAAATAATNYTDSACGTITNGVRTGFTAWEYSGDITPGVKYDISSEGDVPPFTFRLWNRNTETEVSSVTDASANPTELTFEVDGGSILANRLPIYKYSTGLASEGAVKRLDQRIDAVSNDVVTVSNRLETIDTSYWHYSITTGDENVTIANRNQSVTTLISTSAVPSTLHIQIPQEEAMTKDWLIYVFPSTNIVLSLEEATYYVSDASVTNDITSATALYFSQVNPGIYTLGRKEFTAITIQNPVEATVSAALQRNSRRAYIK